jgi:glucan 1,3-beta-glucosidase
MVCDSYTSICLIESLCKTGTTTGIKVRQMLLGTGHDLHFDGVTTGIDSTAAGTAHFNLLDSSAKNTKTLFSGAASAVNTIVLQNVQVDSTVPAVSSFSESKNNIEHIDLFIDTF